METQLEVHGKRVLFFTKVFLTFFIITILLFLNFLDFKENNQNRTYLNLINSVYAKGDEKLSFENYELERVAWLDKNSPGLSKKHIDARNKVVRIFNEYGAGITRMTKGEGDNKNKFILMTDSALRNRIHSNDETHEHPDYSEANVDSALRFYDKYDDSDKVILLIDADTLELAKKFDSLMTVLGQKKNTDFETFLPNGPVDNVREIPSNFDTGSAARKYSRTDFFSTVAKFEGVYVKHDNLVIVTGNDLEGRSQGPAQQAAIKHTFEMPAKTIEYSFPSTLEFAGFDKQIISELYLNPKKKRELKNLYGYFDLNTINDINSKAFEKQNDSVSILGFDISRKWFPIAMFLVLLIIHILLLLTLKEARAGNNKIISEFQSDDALDFLLDNYWIRFFIWVINPLLILLFVFYSTTIQYSLWVYVALVLTGVITVVLGWLSFRKSVLL